MVIKTLMMQNLSFLEIVEWDENIRVDFDISPPTKALPSSSCRPYVLVGILY
ncbi:MAG: hypothetical protein LUO89_16155 [Methanothrix sp.]|nr:hypothetical protein [Methanothrix sp.]